MKRAYHNNEDSSIQGAKPTLEEKDSATESGGRGFSSNEMTQYYDYSEPATYRENLPKEKIKKNENHEEVFNMLVDLGDAMDQIGEENLANFADFLLAKFAAAEEANPTVMFNQLMIKINNADLVNTNEILKKLAKIYSRTVLLEYYKNQDFKKSKASAYQKTLHRAEQYLAEE